MWERISAWNGAANITGILFKDYPESGGYYNFGVADEPLQETTTVAVPTLETIERPDAYEDPDDEDWPKPPSNLTTGSIYDVTAIHIRREKAGGRCLGMRIIHSNGPDDLLGSWDPQDTSSTSILHDTRPASDGPVYAGQAHRALVFIMVKVSRWIYVAGIQICDKTHGLRDAAMELWPTRVRFSRLLMARDK